MIIVFQLFILGFCIAGGLWAEKERTRNLYWFLAGFNCLGVIDSIIQKLST